MSTAVTAASACITVISFGVSILAAYKAARLQYALFEGHTPYGSRCMRRNRRIAIAVWLASGLASVASALIALSGIWQLFKPHGSWAAAIMCASGFLLFALWGIVMAKAYIAFSKRKRWLFFGYRY